MKAQKYARENEELTLKVSEQSQQVQKLQEVHTAIIAEKAT